jgi:hypothetical protein
MTRFFFDVKSKNAIEYDYKGRILPSFEQAQYEADLLAIDLRYTRPELPADTEVQVRGPQWNLLASRPVKSIETLAA